MIWQKCLIGMLAAAMAQTALSARPRPAEPADFDQCWSAWARLSQLEQASPFHGIRWCSLGPVVQGLDRRPGHVAVSPCTCYVTYASGGLWKTTNNGVTFQSIDDQPTMIMGDIAVNPNHSQRVWLGSGENSFSRSSNGGMGLSRSDDGGESWRHLGTG